MRCFNNISQLFQRLSVVLFLGMSLTGAAQVKWITFEEAQQRQKVEQRKFFVDVMTDWCGWCKKMDANTFSQAEIADYLNKFYYPIKFDAEYKEDVLFNGKVYKYIKMGKRGYHELAFEILKGQLGYPSIVFIDEELSVIQPIEGYRGPKEFAMIISYFAGDHHKSVPWKLYSQSLNPQDVLDHSKVVNNKQ